MSSINPLIQSSETKDNSSIDVELETSETAAKTRKSSFFLNPTADSSNELLQLLLSELKEMRMEIKEIKEDVNVMKAEQDIQKEVLKNIEKNQKRLQEDVTQNQQDQKKSLHELKDDVLLKLEKIEKELEYKKQWDIRKRIFGKWRDVKNMIIQTKFENDIFMFKRNRTSCFKRYKLGVKHQDGSTLSVENNKIVLRFLKNQGEEVTREEYYIENDRLVYAGYYYGTEDNKDIYERIGDPDS